MGLANLRVSPANKMTWQEAATVPKGNSASYTNSFEQMSVHVYRSEHFPNPSHKPREGQAAGTAGSLPLYFFGILCSVMRGKLQLHTIFFFSSPNKAQVFFSLSGLAESLGTGFLLTRALDSASLGEIRSV